MSVHGPRLRIVQASPRAKQPAHSRLERDGLATMLLLVGLVPVCGLALLGHWPAWEVGAGAAMSLFALRQQVMPDR
jgi:hypothetical protein